MRLYNTTRLQVAVRNYGQIALDAYAVFRGIEPMDKIEVWEKFGFKRPIISKACWVISWLT